MECASGGKDKRFTFVFVFFVLFCFFLFLIQVTCSAEEGSEIPVRKRRREGVAAASLCASTLTEALLLFGRLYIRRRETAPKWGVARLALGISVMRGVILEARSAGFNFTTFHFPTKKHAQMLIACVYYYHVLLINSLN